MRHDGAMKRFGVVIVVALLVVVVVVANQDDNNGPTPPSGPEVNLSESEAIGIVKAHLAIVSQGGTQTRTVPTMVPCPLGSTDPFCEPCAPGSPNLCRQEMRTEQVEGPAPCPFPPGPQASWSAQYNEGSRTWNVESSELATGVNRWTVDDPSASIISGYCYP